MKTSISFFPIIIYYVTTIQGSFCGCLGIDKSDIAFAFKNLQLSTFR